MGYKFFLHSGRLVEETCCQERDFQWKEGGWYIGGELLAGTGGGGAGGAGGLASTG